MAKQTKAKILQASTSEVYGDPQVHPQNEDYWGHVNPIGPRACYDEGKRVAEALCVAYQQHNSVSVRIARIFNTYGPYMDSEDGRVVMQAFQNAGTRCKAAESLDDALWRKLCWNVPFNGLTVAAGGITTNLILEDDSNNENGTDMLLAQSEKTDERDDFQSKTLPNEADKPQVADKHPTIASNINQ